MITTEEFGLASTNGVDTLAGRIWMDSEQEPRGILQIAHGMIEHMMRYDDFARFMASKGFIVCGNDHLGHGKTAKEGELGHFRGKQLEELLSNDLYEVTRYVRERFGVELPFFILGHSMGSFVTRKYLTEHSDEVKGAIIMGSGKMPGYVLHCGNVLISLLTFLHDGEYHSGLVEQLMFGAYNDHFSRDRFGKDWLTKDKEIQKAYVADPFCSYTFSLRGVKMLICLSKDIQKKKTYGKMRKDLPVLIASGTEDPVGDYGKSVNQLYEDYLATGMTEVSIHMYDNDRHELLNETDRKQVYEDVLGWITKINGEES